MYQKEQYTLSNQFINGILMKCNNNITFFSSSKPFGQIEGAKCK